MEQKESSEKKETIQKRFNRERDEWKTKLSKMSKQMLNVDDLTLLEVSVFSERQILLEYIHNLIDVATRVNAKYKRQFKGKIEFYTNGYDLKLDKSQKTLFSEVDLEALLMKKEVLYNHLNYMRGTLDSIDKLIYGIKWRIEIEKFKKIRT